MGKVSAMAFTILGISFGLYMIGYESAFLQLLTNIGSTTESSAGVINTILIAFGISVGASLVTGLISGGSSLARSSAMIIFFGLFLLNFVCLPITFIYDATLPIVIRMFLMAVLNMMMILMVLDLLTERDL